MILVRRPFVLYDVDAVFALLAIGCVVGAYLGFVIPATRTAHARQTLLGEIQSEQRAIASLRRHIDHDQSQADQLARGIERCTAAIPRLADFNDAVNALVNEAADEQVEIASVVPERPVVSGGRWVSQVRLSGTARSNDCIRFLDALVRRHPYHAIKQFTLSTMADTETSRCSVSMTISLYLLPDGNTTPEVMAP